MAQTDVNRLAKFLVDRAGDYRTAQELVDRIEKQNRETHYARYFTPYGSQLQAIQLLAQGKKVVIILGGNRAGKTSLGSWLAACWFFGKNYFKDSPVESLIQDLPIPENGGTIWAVGLDFPTVRDVIWREHLVGGAAHPPFISPHNPNVARILEREFQIHGTSNQLLTCKSAESGRPKFQGASLDLIWIDEECEGDIYDECYQRTIDRGGRIIVTATPLADIGAQAQRPWLYDLYVAARSGAPDIGVVQLSVFDNPYLPAVEKARLRERWAGHPEESARLYGNFIQRTGRVYPMFSRATHCIAPYHIPMHWRRWCSIDPAATGPTAAIWAAVDPHSGDVYVYREYVGSNRTVSEHAKEIISLSAGESIDFWLIDPKWGAQRNAETHKTGAQLYRECGIPVRLARIDLDYGLGRSIEYMLATTQPSSRHPRLFLFNTLSKLSDQLENYVWDSFQRGPLAGMSKQRPRKGNDDLVNALQYLLATLPPRAQKAPISHERLAKEASFRSYT